MANFELENLISDEVRKKGGLRKKIGLKPSKNISAVRKEAKTKGVGGEQARFFLKAILPKIRRAKKRSMLRDK